MYYDATTGAIEQVAIAYSADGKQLWKLYGSGPVLLRGDPGSWDENYACHGTVLRFQGMYLMWYSGGINHAHEGIGYAESSDGLTWNKDASNPMQVRGGPGSWDEMRHYTPSVIYVANKFSGHGDSCEFKMYYSGVDSGEKNYAIGYKTGTLQAGPAPERVEPVGGVLLSASRLSMLAPYLALLGLTAAVTFIVLRKKRRTDTMPS
jgi:hypothetical protein